MDNAREDTVTRGVATHDMAAGTADGSRANQRAEDDGKPQASKRGAEWSGSRDSNPGFRLWIWLGDSGDCAGDSRKKGMARACGARFALPHGAVCRARAVGGDTERGRAGGGAPRAAGV